MDGWFALTKILKESLIYGRHKVSPKHMSGPVAFQSRAGHHLSYANTVRGRMGDSQSSLLKGWRCRKCGPRMFMQQFSMKRSLIMLFTKSRVSAHLQEIVCFLERELFWSSKWEDWVKRVVA